MGANSSSGSFGVKPELVAVGEVGVVDEAAFETGDADRPRAERFCGGGEGDVRGELAGA